MGAQVELSQHASTRGVDENYIIRKIVGDQQLVGYALGRDHRHPRGIRDRGSLGGLAHAGRYFLPRSNLLWWNLDKAIPHDLALVKTVNGDPISRVALLFASGISYGTDGSVKVI